MKTLFAVLAGSALGAAAFATPSTHSSSQTQNFSFPLSPGNQTLTFNQFDDSVERTDPFKVLQKVVLTFNVTIGANVTAENDSEIASDFFAVNLSGFVTVDALSLSGFAGIDETESVDGGIGASDGVDGSGPDFHDFGFVSGSDDGMDMTTDPEALDAFVGFGTFDVFVFGSGGFSVSGVTDSTLTLSDFGASGSVTIEYFYKIVPTPGAAGMLAMLGLAGVRRRR